jgi:hypothetical protein
VKNIVFSLIGLLLSHLGYGGEDVVKRDTLHREIVFSTPASAKKVIVDNVFGSVSVRGVSGDRVRLTVDKTIRAETDEDLARVLKEIRLDVTEKENEVRIVVDGPFRKDDGTVRSNGDEWEGYSFSFDFDVEVPAEAKIEVSNIGEGDVTVDGVRGDFKVQNINGGIDMRGVEGSGRAYALNRGLTVSFARNPEGHCYFGSLNGEVKVYFLSPFSADLRFKTFNGEVYSDFPMTYLPRKNFVKKTVRRGKTLYQTDPWTPVRVGNGGPTIDFDGFNGDMYVLKQEKII